jgi:DNA-binding XRE family transcriptional regulator
MSTEGRQAGPDPSWFGGRLRELRERQGLTQPQLAGKAGMAKDSLARLERGEQVPTWPTVLLLCAALEVTPMAFCEAPAAAEPASPGRPRRRAMGPVGRVGVAPRGAGRAPRPRRRPG